MYLIPCFQAALNLKGSLKPIRAVSISPTQSR